METHFSVALAGNPNSGKTTMFNSLTGARHRVGNYPGVTVEKREGDVFLDSIHLRVIDLPGIFSLTAYTQEELVARDFLVGEKPDVVVDILNAAALERNLYLCVQFLELGVPLVLSLNMMDEVEKQGKIIDSAKLSRILQAPVVETVARTGRGKEALIRSAHAHALDRVGKWNPLIISYGPDLDPLLLKMTELIEQEQFLTDCFPSRWTALKYLENDEQIIALGKQAGSVGKKLEEMAHQVDDHCMKTLNMHPEAIIADYRYGFIASIIKQGVLVKTNQQERIELSDRIDRVLTHRFFGPAIMITIFYAMFQVTFAIGEIPMGWLEWFFSSLGDFMTSILPDGMLQSLIVSGIIDGVGGVLGFVPLIIIMFVMIAFLEDSGYMARMAYMMDRPLRVFGLHGCSVMPFIVSGGIPGGCAVPGVLAARTLRSPKEKLATLLTAPFMTCGAKTPVFILLAGVFFKNQAATVLFWITIGGWAAALIFARILRSTIIRGEPTPFVMELPPYRLPTVKGLIIHTWERAWQYIRKAGTVILAISILLWAAMTFPSPPGIQGDRSVVSSQSVTKQQSINSSDHSGSKQTVQSPKEEALKYSIAGRIGTAIETVTRYAGFDWRINIALLGGFSAKEVIVSTLATAHSIGAEAPDTERNLADMLRSNPSWNPVMAVSLIVFVMLYAPCFVTVVAIARESSWNWAIFSVVFNTLVAFILAVAVFQLGSLLIHP